MIRRMCATVLVILAANLGFLPPCGAQQPAASTDDELRKSLDSKPVDDYDRELLGDPPAKPEAKPNGAKQLQQRLERELGSAAAPEDEKADPLIAIARQMRQVQSLIAKDDVSDGTQFRQKQIVSDLDKLISQAKSNSRSQSQSKPSQSSGPKPVGQPDPKPSMKPGKSGKVPGEAPAAESDAKAQHAAEKDRKSQLAGLRSMLAPLIIELPPREQEEVLQALPSEEFLPKYELQIEDYYRKLSEGNAKASSER